jgi:hypothetical protein
LDPYNWENPDLGRKVNKYKNPIYSFKVRDRVIEIDTHSESLSHSQIPKIACPSMKLGVIFCVGVCRKMYLENFLMHPAYTL